MAQYALFSGLVVDENGNPVEVTYVGDVPHYVVDDDGFLRHIPAESVDRQVLALMQEGVLTNREAVVAGTLQMMGKDDLFTKAAVEAAINQMDEKFEQLFSQGLPEDARVWLGMMGFQIVINVHGEVVELRSPQEMGL